MLVEFSLETVFSFKGRNICILGNENDFRLLASSIVELTDPNRDHQLILSNLNFIRLATDRKEVIFESKTNAKSLAVLEDERIVFQLDARIWERLFKFFVLMSWNKSTYYLNADDSSLSDLSLEQDCNFICSSEFGIK